MFRILFVCHGNICRSTMAQSVMTELVRRAGRDADFLIDSAATTREALGCTPHHGTVAELKRRGIPVAPHRARQITAAEYGDWDLIVGMDDENMGDLERILSRSPAWHLDGGARVQKLLSFVADGDASPAPRDRAGRVRDVADPWYTGDFTATYRDVLAGCEALLAQLTARA